VRQRGEPTYIHSLFHSFVYKLVIRHELLRKLRNRFDFFIWSIEVLGVRIVGTLELKIMIYDRDGFRCKIVPVLAKLLISLNEAKGSIRAFES